MSMMPTSRSQTVTIKSKYLWLVLAIFLILLAASPAIYYINGLNAPAGSSSGGGVAPVNGPPSTAVNCPNPCTIVIQNSNFGTGALSSELAIVKVGTTVTWSNQDGTQHTTTSNSGIWGSKILNPGNSFSFTFATAGVFPYHCEIHPMQGTIQVVS